MRTQDAFLRRRAEPIPLDALTADEIRSVAAIARGDARLAQATFASVTLHEPAKADVLAWQPGRTLPRQARVQAMTPAGTYEVVVDVAGRRLVSVAEGRGEPSITLSEIQATAAVLENTAFKQALAKRGVTDLTKVFCAPFAAGYYAVPEHDGRRVVKVGCFDTRRSTTNVFGWPIERLYALLDLRRGEVLSVTDSGVVPISDANMNYTESDAGPLRAPRKPTLLAQPAGSNLQMSGSEVTWGKWTFHLRLDPRVGTVVSLARWQDTSGPRSVLYQGYLSEMFVPYMDADYGWQTRTYFDTGEYGAGTSASPLRPSVDCPSTASYLPAVFSSEKGEARSRRRQRTARPAPRRSRDRPRE